MTQPFVVYPRASHDAPEPGAGGADAGAEAAAALGPLAPYLADPAVTDLFLNGSAGLYVDRADGPRPDPEWRASEREVRELAVSLIARGGRHIDDATPCVDVRLAGGVRVHAVLPPIATRGTAVSIRIPRLRGADLDGARPGGDETAAVLALSRDAGIPGLELLRAAAAHARLTARTDGRLRAARHSSRLLLPLGPAPCRRRADVEGHQRRQDRAGFRLGP